MSKHSQHTHNLHTKVHFFDKIFPKRTQPRMRQEDKMCNECESLRKKYPRTPPLGNKRLGKWRSKLSRQSTYTKSFVVFSGYAHGFRRFCRFIVRLQIPGSMYAHFVGLLLFTEQLELTYLALRMLLSRRRFTVS